MTGLYQADAEYESTNQFFLLMEDLGLKHSDTHKTQTGMML